MKEEEEEEEEEEKAEEEEEAAEEEEEENNNNKEEETATSSSSVFPSFISFFAGCTSNNWGSLEGWIIIIGLSFSFFCSPSS